MYSFALPPSILDERHSIVGYSRLMYYVNHSTFFFLMREKNYENQQRNGIFKIVRQIQQEIEKSESSPKYVHNLCGVSHKY